MNLPVTTDFPLLCVEYSSVSLFSNYDFIYLLQYSFSLSNHILFGL